MNDVRLLLELDPTAQPAAAIAREESLAQEVGAGLSPTLRIWECAAALVMPRHRLRAVGDPRLRRKVHGRASGGSAVALGPGVVCVSLALPLHHGQPTIEDTYRLWLAGVGAALRSVYGIETYAADVPGAFCDGAYNAVVGGRKIAGTAQARRGGAALVHGCLLVDVDRNAYCAALAELDGDTDPSLITTLREEAGRAIDRDELVIALQQGFAATEQA